MKVMNIVILLFFGLALTAFAGENVTKIQKNDPALIRTALLPVVSHSAELIISRSTTNALKRLFTKYGDSLELSYAPYDCNFGRRFRNEIISFQASQYFTHSQLDAGKLLEDTSHLSADVLLLYKFVDRPVTNWPEDIFMSATVYLVDMKTRKIYSSKSDIDGTFANDDGESDIHSVTDKLFNKYLSRNQPGSEKLPDTSLIKENNTVDKKKVEGTKTCTTEQILQMTKIGMTDNQIKAACK